MSLATVYERNGGWYISFRWNGKRYRELAGKNILKSDAEQFLAKRQREVQREDIYDKEPERVSFADFAGDFLKTDSPEKRLKDRDESVIEMLKVEWKGLDIGAVTAKMIEDYKAKRLRNRAPATVARELQVAKRLFKKALEWGTIRVNPALTVQKPKVSNTRVRHLKSADLQRVMEKLPADLRPRAVFARFSGARLRDTFLPWSDVDMKAGRIVFGQTKSGEVETIVMNVPIRRLLESLPVPIDSSLPVFGKPWGMAAKMKINRDWRAACAAANVQDFRFHDLRHQCATDLISQGATLYDVQAYLRHRSPAMTARYAHMTDDRMEKTAHLLDRLEAKREKKATD